MVAIYYRRDIISGTYQTVQALIVGELPHF